MTTTTTHLAIGSLAVGISVLALKAFAYWLTGSVALLSDALESIVNVVTALVALVAIRVAAAPADAAHPYGHYKAEFFSAVIEGAMIIVAAVLIMNEAWKGLLSPRPLDAPFEGLLVNGLATAINGLWCWVLIVWGRRHKSPALVADGHHLLSDVLSSGAVVVGVLLAVLTGWYVLDPILAGLVAINILRSGWNVVTSSLSGLLDEAVPEEQLSRMRTVIATATDGVIEVHDLRTRHAGRMTFVDCHLVVPGTITVNEAHAKCDAIEDALREEFGDVTITIHVEPDSQAEEGPALVL
ncbi:cation diffusion facilitator family transporter [Pleomorphomonas sp. NRK KF1]|uniref:cation diffusion facilitator family transporter n=1 Tax=Pleomorphomonas sp. NRK KF1 TaxID=2943000 RepID=UPI002043B454|nr:cation diffusion facilitator family transporter [Pleomorphomonas sp. NRK KF1]MCM5554066.1 cation diffusion facilitator family transporter [Pleomorphomonas sp. NRK KF1]